MGIRIGIDVGGTFTDVAVFDEDVGALRVFKTGSTPHDQSEGILTGLHGGLSQVNRSASEVSYLAHGTTVGTNAILEETRKRMALFTTEGFRDLLEIGRQKRPDLYDLFVDKPRPLVPRELRFEVRERVGPSGEVVRPLDVDPLHQILEDLAQDPPAAIAVCFLFSFLHPDHEQQIRRLLQTRFPDAYISLSSEVVPEFREFERSSTTVLNAYLGPVMKRYLTNFEVRVRDARVRVSPYIAQSSGGIMSIAQAIESPVRTVASGPSAGVVGAVRTATASGYHDLITLDMGGTSTDVCLVKNGQPLVATGRLVAGYPIQVPMVDVHSIGAGGGSIAWVDGAGGLWVGPQSAGADPGPACYARGGEGPTVTDANVVLGRLNPEALLDGTMPIRAELAETAIARMVAEPLELGVPQAAAGILDVVVASMVRALRLVSVERGENPADLVLVAHGGAGPLHAALVAAELGCPRVLIPPHPGILCGLGLLLSDMRMDFVRSRRIRLAPDALETIAVHMTELEQAATDWFDSERIPPDRRVTRRQADLRYSRQNFELTVKIPNGRVDANTLDALATAFHTEHEKQYGYAMAEEPIDLINFRVIALGQIERHDLGWFDQRASGQGELAPASVRPVWFDGEYVETPVYRRSALETSVTVGGPAIIEQYDSTTVVPPGWRSQCDTAGNLTLLTEEG